MKIVITGSRSGIGLHLARHFGKAGHEIWGLARHPQEELRQQLATEGVSFRFSCTDISDWSQMARFREEVGAAWPHIDVLICCAGIQGPLGAAMSADPTVWSQGVRTNLDGTYYTIRALHDLLLKHAAPRARVMCLSGGGSSTPRVNFTPYAAAKAGVVRLVETLAHEWEGGTVDINAIAPGAINTRMTEEVLGHGPDVVGAKEFAHASKQKADGGASLERLAAMLDLLISPAGNGVSGRLISAVWDPWDQLAAHRGDLAGSDIYTLRRILPQDRGRDWKMSPAPVAAKAIPAHPKITVMGLWHLGSVTAACCARHFQVTGLDFDDRIVTGLRQGQAPILEPGLNDLLQAGLGAKRLQFMTDPKLACADADILWVCYDTPVNENDESDVESVLTPVRHALPHLPKGALVLVSAQLPVGTCRRLETEFPYLNFACSPENLRLGKALDAFEKADRAVVGVRNAEKKALLETLFAPFTPQVLFMRVESAEMVKHALNSFLALSVTFINEIARLCEQVGADAREVAAGLKSEARIGPKAYLGPGGPFAGGTLARDVVTLSKLAREKGETISVIPAVKQSNDLHRSWALHRLQAKLGDLRGKTVALLGLVYTPNTDTLRRSAAVELCQALLAAGAEVTAFDPAIKQMPPELVKVRLATEPAAALAGADAVVVGTEWPQFRQMDWAATLPRMKQPLVIDANRFLEKELKNIPAVEHLSVGRT